MSRSRIIIERDHADENPPRRDIARGILAPLNMSARTLGKYLGIARAARGLNSLVPCERNVRHTLQSARFSAFTPE